MIMMQLNVHASTFVPDTLRKIENKSSEVYAEIFISKILYTYIYFVAKCSLLLIMFIP